MPMISEVSLQVETDCTVTFFENCGNANAPAKRKQSFMKKFQLAKVDC